MNEELAEQISYMRRFAMTIRSKVLDSPGGTDGIAALVLRQASTFIISAAALAEEYEAERIIREEKSNAR